MVNSLTLDDLSRKCKCRACISNGRARYICKLCGVEGSSLINVETFGTAIEHYKDVHPFELSVLTGGEDI